MIIKGLNFRQTVGNSPEQYDVFDCDGVQVGYVQLRWGRVCCRCPDAQGAGIYYYDVGDRNWVGGFESEEQRMSQLTIIADKILEREGRNKREMNPMDYKFEVGDKVISIYGEVGQITEICDCESCKKRGFYELTWVENDGENHGYITNHDAEYGFDAYRQIGKYEFDHPFKKEPVLNLIGELEKSLAVHKKHLRIIEEMEKAAQEIKPCCDNCAYYRADVTVCCYPGRVGDYVQPYTVCPEHIFLDDLLELLDDNVQGRRLDD